MVPILVHLRPKVRQTGAVVDVRLSSVASGALAGLGGLEWEPAISTRPSSSLEVFDLAMSGAIQTPKSDLTVLLSNIKSVDPDTLTWNGADAVIYRPVDETLERAQVRFRGTIKTAASDITTRRMSLSLEVSTKMVDRPVLRTAFSGSGGAGGDPEVRGTLKPAGFGNVKNVGVVFFDMTRNIGMIDGYGNCLAITWLGEGLSSLGPSVGDFESYAALADAIDTKTIIPGRWGTCIAEGMIGLGAPPVRNITCHARFGYGLPGSLMRRLLDTHARVPAALIDDAAFTALDAAVPRPVHYWLQEQRNALDMIQALAASCNASPIITFDNAISVTRIFDGANIGTVSRGGWADINPTAWRSADVLDTYWQVAGIGARPGSVSDRADVLYADDFADKGVYNPATVYRQGDQVYLRNRSQWLYINSTASAGHAPPDPLESDSYWQQLQPAQKAGDITYEDGTPIEYLKPTEPAADITKSLDLSTTTINLSTTATGTIVAGQLPLSIKATRRRGGTDVSATTGFTLAILGSVTATIDNDPASIARGTITVTDVQSSATLTVTSLRDGAQLPGTITITLPDGIAPPPTESSASLTSFPTIKSRTPTYPAAPASFVSAKADSAGRISMALDVTYYFRNEGSPAYDYGSLTAVTRMQYRPTGGSSWTDATGEIVGTEAYRGGNTTTGKIDTVQGRLNTGYVTVSGLTPGAIYDAGVLLRAQPVPSTSKGQGDPTGAFTVRTGT